MEYLKPFSAPLNLLLILLFLGCSLDDDSHTVSENSNLLKISENNKHSSPLKILPLGDSRVEGGTFNSVSYRYHLWQDLVLNGFEFDLVGPLTGSENHPPVNGKYFDQNHAGVGGFRTIDILNNIDIIINNNYNPDIVLLGIGGNDLTANIPVSTAINNISEIIHMLQHHNPKVTILLEQIAPGRSTAYSPGHFSILAQFNYQIKTLAYSHTTYASKVIFVNMYEDWQDDYLTDNTHYNAQGAKIVAGRYYNVLQKFLH